MISMTKNESARRPKLSTGSGGATSELYTWIPSKGKRPDACRFSIPRGQLHFNSKTSWHPSGQTGARAAFLRAEPTGARFTPRHFTRWAHAALACCPKPRRSSFVDRLGRPDTVDVRVRRPAGGAEPRPAVSALRQVQPPPRPQYGWLGDVLLVAVWEEVPWLSL